MDDRLRKYFMLNTAISYLSDNEINNLYKKESTTYGWGKNDIVTINNEKIFIKKYH